MRKNLCGIFAAIFVLTISAGAFQASGTVPEKPVRGIWAHPRMFGPDRATAVPLMGKTLDEYVRAGIDTVIMLVKDTSGYVYYRSGIAIGDPAYSWDFFGTFLEEAKKRSISVHPWFCVFPEGQLLGQVREHPEWLVRSRRNELVACVNPAIPAARAYELSLMTELARNYPVDWIHLDYIRFPCEPTEPYFGYDAATRALFKERSGWDTNDIKDQDSGNPVWNVWLEWNRDRVTTFVRELKSALGSVGRPVKISAAVFPEADNARVLIGQDWSKWAEEGLVDMLCPMIYTNDAALFDDYVRRAVAIGKGRTQVCIGIGIGTSHNRNTPEGMLEQMRISRELGADGVIYFSANSLVGPFLDRLKAGD